MKPARVLAIAKKNLQALRHDKRTVGFLVIMPLFLIIVFGYAFGGDVENLDVYVVNLDSETGSDSFAVRIINDLETRNVLDIVKVLEPDDGVPDPVSVARQKVLDAEILAVLVFSETFSADVARIIAEGGGMPAAIQMLVDGTNPNIVSAMYNDLQNAIRNVLGFEEVTPPITVASDLIYGEDAEFIDFFAPGVMGLAAMMVTFMLSIISFVHERSAFTLERLLSTPVTEGEIVAGYALAFGLVGLIQSVVILSAAVLIFQIQIVGSALVVLLIVFVFGVGNQGLGFLLSSLAKNEFQAVQFMPLVLFPSILLSGVFWPLEAVPDLIRPVSFFIPLTYAVSGLRSVMIRGWGVGDIWLELCVLLAFATVMLLLSTYGLKKRR